MNVIPVDSWKEDMQVFQEAAKKYYAGELKRAEYKGISGKFGSYAQKGDEPKSMLRLRMPAGRLTREKMAFIAESVRKYAIVKSSLPPARLSSCTIWGWSLCAGLWRMP